ncbi:MAG TPA: AMP-binding protein [Nevskiaceae bacterium]|nr:AMP-binding protein [Nevskiaceae bacterium]
MSLDLIAAHDPARPALWWDGRWYRYGELGLRARRLAAALASIGIARGDRVAIYAHNHLAHIELVLAAPLLGFIYTPYNFRLSAGEQQALTRYLKPRLMLADAAHLPFARTLGVEMLALDQYESWIDTARAALPPVELDERDAHMILLTGGSTGLPKGALISYRQVLANCTATAAGWDLWPEDCAIQATPCFHAALNVFTTPLLKLGGRVVLMRDFEPGAYLRLAAQHGASVLFMVPTMYRMLTEHADFPAADLSQVRWAISGGAPCPPTVRAPFAARGIRFRQGYGMTECGVNCFAIGLDEAEKNPDAVGRPLPQLQAAVRRADGSACAADEIGELTLSGPQVCSGYFEREAQWRKVYRDGWLWTGDLARVGADGLYRIVGRSKEMYISGGENVYPAEVEAALAQCAGVAECAVIGIADEKWGEVGLAAVVLKPGHAADEAALRAELKTRLAGYKVPRAYFFLPALPKSGAGKILKPDIRRQYEQPRA